MKDKSMEFSPMIANYLLVKEQYKDAILLYRLGDFYECFFEDALKVSKALDIVLTGRSCGLEERAPMCGVPAHAIDSYLSKLVQQGYKVAICEQLSTPVKGKMVERGVVRVVSAGTVIEEDILNGSVNNYLASIYVDEKNQDCGAVAYSDISTGEFVCVDISGKNILQKLNDELVRISPTEIICNSMAKILSSKLGIISAGIMPEFQVLEDWNFDYVNSQKQIMKSFNLESISGLDISKSKPLVSACGGILEYLKQTQMRVLSHLKLPKVVQDRTYMYLDASTLRNLELTARMRDGKVNGTLLNVLDYTKTNIGARLLKKVITQPLQNKVQIEKRLNSVEELVNNSTLRLNLLSTLTNFADIERICSRIVYGTVLPKECISLKTSLLKVPELKALLSKASSELLIEINAKLLDISELAELLEKTIVDEPPATMKDGNFIKRGFNETLDEYKDIRENGTDLITKLQMIEIEQTGIKNLRIKYNKVFGYFIEIPSSAVEKVPLRYVRKQTISNNERYITDELKEIENKILNSQEKSLELENEIYSYVKDQLAKNISLIQEIGNAVAELDVYLSFAVSSEKNNYVKPNILESGSKLEITSCRHPVVEKILKNTSFVSNDVLLDNEQRIMIITGPNMAGKSTYMREIALAVLMAHIGCFICADKAEIPIIDRIFTRVGASDDLSFGQSTFMVEMVEVANILNNATENSLLILDEVGRGTSTYDGLSIAWSIMDYLSKKLKAKTLFATHYFELTNLEGKLEGVKNFRIAVKEINDNVIFLRKIVRGGANRSFGIQVASLAGVPKEVTDNAKEILEQLERQKPLNLNEIEVKESQEVVLESEIAVDIKSILEDLKKININEVTPLKALEILSEFVERVDK